MYIVTRNIVPDEVVTACIDMLDLATRNLANKKGVSKVVNRQPDAPVCFVTEDASPTTYQKYGNILISQLCKWLDHDPRDFRGMKMTKKVLTKTCRDCQVKVMQFVGGVDLVDLGLDVDVIMSISEYESGFASVFIDIVIEDLE